MRNGPIRARDLRAGQGTVPRYKRKVWRTIVNLPGALRYGTPRSATRELPLGN